MKSEGNNHNESEEDNEVTSDENEEDTSDENEEDDQNEEEDYEDENEEMIETEDDENDLDKNKIEKTEASPAEGQQQQKDNEPIANTNDLELGEDMAHSDVSDNGIKSPTKDETNASEQSEDYDNKSTEKIDTGHPQSTDSTSDEAGMGVEDEEDESKSETSSKTPDTSGEVHEFTKENPEDKDEGQNKQEQLVLERSEIPPVGDYTDTDSIQETETEDNDADEKTIGSADGSRTILVDGTTIVEGPEGESFILPQNSLGLDFTDTSLSAELTPVLENVPTATPAIYNAEDTTQQMMSTSASAWQMDKTASDIVPERSYSTASSSQYFTEDHISRKPLDDNTELPTFGDGSNVDFEKDKSSVEDRTVDSSILEPGDNQFDTIHAAPEHLEEPQPRIDEQENSKENTEDSGYRISSVVSSFIQTTDYIISFFDPLLKIIVGVVSSFTKFFSAVLNITWFQYFWLICSNQWMYKR